MSFLSDIVEKTPPSEKEKDVPVLMAPKKVEAPRQMRVAAAAPTRSAPPPPNASPNEPLPGTPEKNEGNVTAPAASPLIPELRLDKLLAQSPEGPDMQKYGADAARAMGDLFQNLGSSMDNLLQEKKPQEKKPERQRGTIVA